MSDAERASWREEAVRVRTRRNLELLDTLHGALSTDRTNNVGFLMYKMHLYQVLGLDDLPLLADLERSTRRKVTD